MSEAIEAIEAREAGPRRIEVRGLWRYSLPLHAAIPLVIAGLGAGHDALYLALFLGIHLGFPAALALTYPLWRGQGAEVVGLVVTNHLVTFAVGSALLAMMAG